VYVCVCPPQMHPGLPPPGGAGTPAIAPTAVAPLVGAAVNIATTGYERRFHPRRLRVTCSLARRGDVADLRACLCRVFAVCRRATGAMAAAAAAAAARRRPRLLVPRKTPQTAMLL
jgi:hypothetical protein